jgi:hypothetical protein
MYQLIYDETKEKIYQIDPTGKQSTLTEDFPSKPEFSSTNKKAIYISPLEWEVPGSLYLYNLENGYITELISPDQYENVPKYAIWIDDNKIAVIIGYGAGTVAVGGNVYIYYLEERKLQQVTNYTPETQITKISKNDNQLELFGIKYVDNLMDKFEEYSGKIDL